MSICHCRPKDRSRDRRPEIRRVDKALGRTYHDRRQLKLPTPGYLDDSLVGRVRMDRDFENKVVLLTGGAGDIARATAHRIIERGGRIVLTDQDGDGLRDALGDINAPGSPAAESWVLDVTDVDTVERVFGEIHAAAGRIDVLVNCAGIYRHREVIEMSEEEWDATLDVNLKGVFATCRAAGRLMTKQAQGGVIVNLASVSAQRGSTLHAHYCASKAGVVGFGRALALELAPKVRVNAIAPGIIESRMIAEMLKTRGDTWRQQIPLERFGTPEDVADAICFLSSDKSSYITGSVLNVNGGLWMD